MDWIFIRCLRVSAAIGLLPDERLGRQTVEIDIRLAVDASLAASDDKIDKTVDYSAVRMVILDFLAANRFDLLETLASRLADWLLTNFSATSLELTIFKPGVFHDAAGAGVTVHRTKSGQ